MSHSDKGKEKESEGGQAEMSGSQPPTDLPPEIWANIIDFLDPKGQANLSLVSRQMRNLARNPLRRAWSQSPSGKYEVLKQDLSRIWDRLYAIRDIGEWEEIAGAVVNSASLFMKALSAGTMYWRTAATIVQALVECHVSFDYFVRTRKETPSLSQLNLSSKVIAMDTNLGCWLDERGLTTKAATRPYTPDNMVIEKPGTLLRPASVQSPD